MPKSGIDARRKAALKEGGAAYLARREEIVRAAASVFRQRGFDAATLSDVAKMLGTDRASLYYYVGSKEELLQEIVRDALKDVFQTAETIERNRMSAPDKIRALIESMVTNYIENYPHMSVYTEDLARIARQDSEWAVDVIERTRRYEELAHSVFMKGKSDGTLRGDVPVELAALALFGMINWMHRWYRPNFEFSAQEIAAAYNQIFLNGCAAPTSRRVSGQGRAAKTA
jgi:AcrR family transcriptional regulator